MAWRTGNPSVASSPPDRQSASWAGERLDTFVKGADNAAVAQVVSLGGWSGWESLGGGIDGSPAAVSWSSGRIDVFARGMDNALWHKWLRRQLERLGIARRHDHRRPCGQFLGTGAARRVRQGCRQRAVAQVVGR